MMGDWRSIDDMFEEMRQHEEDIDEALRRRYEEGTRAIAAERDTRVREGRMGKLPK